MLSFTAEDLRSYKRNQLQRIAKQNGIKANMKNGDLIVELEKLLTGNNAGSEDNVTDKKKSLVIEDMPDDTTKSDLDIMSVKPPWENTDFDMGSPTDEDNSCTSPDINTEPQAKKARRTRSSSRNRTPKVTGNVGVAEAKRTFSVKRKSTKALTAQTSESKGKINVNKRKRDSVTTLAENIESVQLDKENNRSAKKLSAKLGKENIKKKEVAENSTSRIPRFAASGVTIGTSKAVTLGAKDWKKIHAKSFKYMESIDEYQRRKEERAKRLLGSKQKTVESLSRLARPRPRGSPKVVKSIKKGLPRPDFASPATRNTPKTPRSIMRKSKKDTKTKTPQNQPFKYTVTSTSKMNLAFGQKTSRLATPKHVRIVSDQNAAKQTYVKTPGTGIRSKSTISTPGEKRKSLAATPKAANASNNAAATPGGTKKATFDIKESLKKPLTWKPHRGPLQPYNDTTKKPSFKDRIETLKDPKIPSRESKRQKIAEKKKISKDKRMMERRGIK